MFHPEMEPPFTLKPFEEMNKKEAYTYFDWYVGSIAERMEVLKEKFRVTGGDITQLDYTPASLVPLWDWFLPNIKTVPRHHKDIEAEFEEYPEWLHEFMRNDEWTYMDFTKESIATALDIAMYFSEVLMKEHPTLKWGLFTKPKREVGVNEPHLHGFKWKKYYLDPNAVVHSLMLDIVEGERSKASDELLRAYQECVILVYEMPL